MNWWQADQQRVVTSDGLMAAVQTATGLLLIVTSRGLCREDVFLRGLLGIEPQLIGGGVPR